MCQDRVKSNFTSCGSCFPVQKSRLISVHVSRLFAYRYNVKYRVELFENLLRLSEYANNIKHYAKSVVNKLN